MLCHFGSLTQTILPFKSDDQETFKKFKISTKASLNICVLPLFQISLCTHTNTHTHKPQFLLIHENLHKPKDPFIWQMIKSVLHCNSLIYMFNVISRLQQDKVWFGNIINNNKNISSICPMLNDVQLACCITCILAQLNSKSTHFWQPFNSSKCLQTHF